MSNELSVRLGAELAQFREDGVYKRLNYLEGPQGPRSGWKAAARWSSSPPTTTSDWPTSPKWSPRAGRHWTASAPGPPRSGSSAARSPSTASSSGPARGWSARERAFVRVSCWNANEALPDPCSAERRPGAVRPAQSRLDHRRNPARQGDHQVPDRRLRPRRPGRPRRATRAPRKDRRIKMVITDGIFSMEGAIANLPGLARGLPQARAILVVDDSHSTGVLGRTGRGTAEHFGLVGDSRHHHLDAGEGAGRGGGRVRGRLGRSRRLSHPAGAAPALQQCAAMHRSRQRHRRDPTISRPIPSVVRRLRENTAYFRAS